MFRKYAKEIRNLLVVVILTLGTFAILRPPHSVPLATLKTGKAKGDWEFDAFVRGANEILNDLERLGMQDITLGEYFVVSVSVPVRREDAVKHQGRIMRK